MPDDSHEIIAMWRKLLQAHEREREAVAAVEHIARAGSNAADYYYDPQLTLMNARAAMKDATTVLNASILELDAHYRTLREDPDHG